MNRGRLAKYSLWQFRDFVIERGIAIVMIGLLLGYVLLEPLRRAMGAGFSVDASSPARPVLIMVTSSIVSLAVLMAVNGIVSTDRKMGYYRFLFAKPVSPVAYYAQLFFVYMVGVLASMLVLASLLHSVTPSFGIVKFLIYTALIFVAMGGIGFFISVATRFDWLTLAAVWLGSRVLRDIYGSKPGLAGKLVQVLPPVHKLNDIATDIIVNGSAAASDVVWLAGYGAVFFVLGLGLLRYGPLAD
ncbi:MAG: hypothetical protein ABI408_01710 [Gemmatimonadaceae bacterium]